MYVCNKCKNTFETGITYQNGKHQQLDCPVCKSFVKFLQQPVTNPGKELLPYGKYVGKSFEDVWAADPGYIRWFVGVNGRPGRVAQAFLQLMANAENSAIPVEPPTTDGQQDFDF